MNLRLRPGVSTADTAYGTVLLDERTGDYWQLNPTAARVVALLGGGGSAAQAAAALAEEFDVDPAQAMLDVTALVDQLRAARLVARRQPHLPRAARLPAPVAGDRPAVPDAG